MLRISKESKNSEVKEEEELGEIVSDLVEAKIEEFDIKDESIITEDLLSEIVECKKAPSDDPEFNEDDNPDNSSESDSIEDDESSEDENNKLHSISKDDTEFQCNLCDKKFTGKSPLLRHDTIVHSGKKYSCEICNKKYRYKKYLQSHVENFHDASKIVASTKVSKKKQKSYKCRECSLQFTNQIEYRKHHSANHMPRIHKCEVCYKMFKTLQILNTHKITHLTFEERNKLESVKKYLCSICGKVLYSSSNRDSHVRGHSGETPFKCAVCDKGFKQKYLLSVHMSKHTEERPFKCEICGNCFKNQTQFNSHQLTHKLKDMEKQFECKICGVKFRYKLNLTHHMKNIHLGIRNYKCDLCDQAFYTSNLMRQHKAKKHQDE